MLTEEKKQEILQEEKFRLKTQQELKSKNKKSNFKTWEFLNSNFGIWFLSSVALGIISWGYSQINQTIEKNKKYQIEIRKHDLEISSRIKYYKSEVYHLKQNGDYFKSNDILLGTTYSAFPEFQNLSLRTILLEQSVIVNDERQLEINKAIEGLDKISRNVEKMDIGMDREDWQSSIDKKLIKNAKELISILNKNFSSKYWN